MNMYLPLLEDGGDGTALMKSELAEIITINIPQA